MRIENETLYISKIELENILTDIRLEEDSRILLSEQLLETLESELFINELHGKYFNKITIEDIRNGLDMWKPISDFEMVPKEDKYPYDPYCENE